MQKVTSKVINIERFGTHDGPGIRTVIFFKGCALRCQWCANPESQSFEPEILFLENACKSCGECIRICPRHAVSLIPEYGYISDPSLCDFCLKCVEGCIYNARLPMGTTYDAETLWDIVVSDKDYYLESGGGITFSGGEPLFYVDMILELASRAREHGFTTLIETCGHVPTDAFEQINGAVDWIYFDFKHIDSHVHAQLTGQGNELILKNLEWVDKHFAGRYAVRYPYIPNKNDAADAVDAFFYYASQLQNCQELVLLPYHRLGETKYNGLGRVYEMHDQLPLTHSDLEAAVQRGRSFGLNVKTE